VLLSLCVADVKNQVVSQAKYVDIEKNMDSSTLVRIDPTCIYLVLYACTKFENGKTVVRF